MQSIPVKLSNASYEIRVGRGLFEQMEEQLRDAGLTPPYLLVTQPRILKAIGARALRPFPVTLIADGERAKTMRTVTRLLDEMVRRRLPRQATVIALGGGVVGDVAAFVASTYMRGINVVQVPTTLLAQVDSSIGGKTGVNHKMGKNLIGTFHQPRLVLADPNLLRTLPEREYNSGLYESLKYGVIRDPVLFEFFELESPRLRSRDPEAIERLVAACATIKAYVVMADEREGDLRRILNFGHTTGHALEAAAAYRGIKHGEAVGYGMIAASRIASRMGWLNDPSRVRIENAVNSVGKLPALRNVTLRSVLGSLQHDKKVRDGRVHFVLPTMIGHVRITPDVPAEVVRDVVKELLNESARKR